MTSVNSKIADASVHHQVDLLRIEAGLERDVLKLMQGLSGDLSALLAKKGAWAGDDIPGDMKRIQKLQKQSDAIIDDLYGKLDSETTSEMKDAARYAAEWVPSAINTAIGANIADVTLTTELLNSVVKNTLVEGAPSAAWWAKQSGDLKLNFMREMRTGILQGENLSDLTRRIRGRRENGYADGLLPPGKDATTGRTIRATMRPATRNAQALAITSVQQVMGDARMEAYRQNSDLIKGVQQISTLDGRTSPVCRAYDHAARDLEGNPLPGLKELPPGGPTWHWRCRSVLVPICKSWEELGAKGVKEFHPGSRASMDGQVADHIDYETWLKGKPEAFQREVLGPSRYDLWQNGKVNLRDMVDQRGRPVRVKELALPTIPIDKIGTTSAPFNKAISDTLAGIPQHVHDVVEKFGYKLQTAPKLTDALPHLKGVHPRGWPAGMTWDSVEGAHGTARKDITIAETYRPPTQKIFVPNKRVEGTLRHEFGHAADAAYGSLSNTPDFITEYGKDRNAMDAAAKIKMKYLLQGGLAGRQEAFAEVFCEMMGGGNNSDAATYFPNVAKYIKDTLGV